MRSPRPLSRIADRYTGPCRRRLGRRAPRAETLYLVSLLGRKKDNGPSEYSFYSFRGGHEDMLSKPTFQEWLDNRFGIGHFVCTSILPLTPDLPRFLPKISSHLSSQFYSC
jgi:hypothetical protein